MIAVFVQKEIQAMTPIAIKIVMVIVLVLLS